MQYSDLEIKQAYLGTVSGMFQVPSANDPTATIQGDDWSIGFTFGLLWKPIEGTSIGVGYRSRMNNTLEGSYKVDSRPNLTRSVQADFDLPEIITVSLHQSLTPKMRILGTFEWTNWSILETVNVIDKATGTVLQSPTIGLVGDTSPVQFEANWDDGYFLSGGLEYDYSDQLTVRGGVAYEWSPVQKATQRLLAVPDADRLWLSAGATYKFSEQTSFDLAYTHIFVDDSDILYSNGFSATSEGSVDIISVSYKTKWGADGPFGLLSGLNN